MVKKDLAAREKSSGDSDDAFMAKLDEEDANEKVTISYFKRNLKLVVSLLDLIIEMKDEKDLINNSLDIIQDGKVALVSQISDIESQMVVLETENLELKEKIKGATTKIFKEKNEASRLQTLKISCILLK